ncbi:MAG: outer membrane protein assembly factor BamD [Verrucomicrobiota bacterium]|jgi:outer membrane protein assembly factor BamD (BamD/ComL family)
MRSSLFRLKPVLRTLMLRSLLLLLTLPIHAALAAGLEESADFITARQALADGLPGVAAVKAERLLPLKGWTKDEQREIATFAAEAWVRAGNGTETLRLAGEHELSEEFFWRAQALALLGRLGEAREELVSTGAALPERAQLLLGQILMSLREFDAARDEVKPLITAEAADLRNHARQLLAEIEIEAGKADAAVEQLKNLEGSGAELLRARARLMLGDVAAARKSIQAVLDVTDSGQRARDAASVLLAEVLLREGSPAKAFEHLTTMLDASVQSELWTEACDALDRAWRALPAPRVLPAGVLLWAAQGSQAQQSPQPPAALRRAIDDFRGHAYFLIACWMHVQGRSVEALGMLEAFLQMHPEHPRISAAMRLAMEMHVTMQNNTRVLELAEEWRARFSGSEGSGRVDFLAGSILHRRGDHAQAQESFQAAANVATTLPQRRRALFNAAVAASRVSDIVLFLGLMAQLEVTGGAQDGVGDSAADLQLEKALESASTGKDDTEDALRAFIASRPNHPRINDARIALAEWLLVQSPPRVEDSRRILDETRPAAGSPTAEKLQERIDYTRLWQMELAGDTKSLTAACTEFGKKWPRSALLPDVLMKQASAHFQAEDFASARVGFELVAKDYPKSAHADTAQYFAALSAMSVMSNEGRERAMTLWDALAKKNGPLALAARRQQALAHRRQGDLVAASAALDQVLALKTLDAETRRLCVCEKAEVLLLQGKTTPDALIKAIELLRAFLAEGDKLEFVWKARAGFTLATVLHEAERDSDALEACYDVLRAADGTPPANPSDYLWYSKTGFFGIELLQAAHQWEAAARLAEQIAQLPGDRANDARQLATKIRLEHFLWDGPKPVPPKVPDTEPKSDAKKK